MGSKGPLEPKSSLGCDICRRILGWFSRLWYKDGIWWHLPLGLFLSPLLIYIDNFLNYELELVRPPGLLLVFLFFHTHPLTCTVALEASGRMNDTRMSENKMVTGPVSIMYLYVYVFIHMKYLSALNCLKWNCKFRHRGPIDTHIEVLSTCKRNTYV